LLHRRRYKASVEAAGREQETRMGQTNNFGQEAARWEVGQFVCQHRNLFGVYGQRDRVTKRVTLPQKVARDQTRTQASESEGGLTLEWTVTLCTGGRDGSPVG